MLELSDFQKKILDEFQCQFPIVSRPFTEVAKLLHCQESEVIETIKYLIELGYINRLGPVFQPQTIGTSCLAAVSTSLEEEDLIAEIISSYECVNHNYARTHKYNLWFVMTAKDQETLNRYILEIENEINLKILVLPLLKEYHINLGFKIFGRELECRKS